MLRSSFSQHNLFSICPRTWYWSKILKVPVESDFTYANAGTCIHKALEEYYKNKDRDKTKEVFERQWASFKLDQGFLKFKKDEYWLMVINGMDLELPVTSTELKIYYPEIVAYIDAVVSSDDRIVDWKSSKRSEENEKEYEQQLKLYAWLYYRKFGRIPKQATVYYLRYSGSKGELSFSFTEDDVKEVEEWFNSILEKMQYYIDNPKELPQWNFDYHWCPYKHLWDVNGEGSIKFTLHLYGNYLHLEGPVTPLLEKGIVKKFSYELKNAHWIKKSRPMANTTVSFWDSTNKNIPLGFKDALLVTLQHYAKFKGAGLLIDIQDHRVFNGETIEMPDNFLNGKVLRDYQEDAVRDFLSRKVGILEIGTGGGKTEISIECIRKLGLKTLFIVDKIELLRQTKKRIEESLGIEVGVIGAGEEDVKHVTVATVQSLKKNIQKYVSYLRTIRFGVFDECHKTAARSYVTINRYLTGADFKLGLSGTAFRDDGNDLMINSVVGFIIKDLGSKKLIEMGWLTKPTICFIKEYMPEDEVKRLSDESKVGLINETEDYPSYYDSFITNNTFRNNKILEVCNENSNKKILILTKLIDHGKLLQESIPNSQHLYGGTNKEERKTMFENFVKGNNNVLISTISIFAEGIDIPELDVVINASANKGDVKTIQVLGRVLRKLVGKDNALYYDFWDETKFFRMASIARRKALINQGHDVTIIH